MGLRTWLYEKTGLRLKNKPTLQDKHKKMLSWMSGDSSLGQYSYIAKTTWANNAHVGRYCSIAPQVMLGSPHHPIDWLSSSPYLTNHTRLAEKLKSDKKHYVIIGNDVWIGYGAVVLNGITIGDGVIVGAGAVVTKDVPPYAIVAGNPAKVIRYRFDEQTINTLLELAWWELDVSELHGVEFDNISTAIEQIKSIKKIR